MKYLFVCAVHNLKLDEEETRVKLNSGYLSNEMKTLETLFDNNLSIGTLGLHAIDEIKETPTYYMMEGNLGYDVSWDEVDRSGTSLCFGILRQIQRFVNSLWHVRDNAVYVRDGYLYVYINDISRGCTFKASVSAVNTFADGTRDCIEMGKGLLEELGKKMEVFIDDSNALENRDYKNATQIQHYKKSGLNRKELAECYVALARSQGAVPMRLLLYCSAIEALVANSTTELSHRTAERAAVLIGHSQEERMKIYSDIKIGYDVRSKVAHGDLIKKEMDSINECSQRIDGYLRELLKLDEPYTLDKSKIDEFYLKELIA